MTYSYRNDDLYYHAISYHVLRISRKQKENRKILIELKIHDKH